MIKVAVVFGTRPEAIKMAPIIRGLREHRDEIECQVCITAQHREMLDQVLNVFGIVPDHDLNLMRDSQTPTQVASAVLAKLEPVLQIEKPDWILVQGDTTTVAAASLAAYYAGIKVGHVEAGLRTNDKWNPFPEEVNRRLASVIADLHFAPTESAQQNLLREGVDPSQIIVTGNPVIDALHWIVGQPCDISAIGIDLDLLKSSKRLILVTAHRRESFGRPLEDICHALRRIAELHDDSVHIIYPVHRNPQVAEPVHRLLQGVPNISLVPPLDYLTMSHLLKRSYLVLTDSGGLQEEAPSLGKPVLVLRETTERPEGVQAGVALLVGTNTQHIVETTTQLLNDSRTYAAMAYAVNPYGDGHASERVIAALVTRAKTADVRRPSDRLNQ